MSKSVVARYLEVSPIMTDPTARTRRGSHNPKNGAALAAVDRIAHDGNADKKVNGRKRSREGFPGLEIDRLRAALVSSLRVGAVAEWHVAF